MITIMELVERVSERTNKGPVPTHTQRTPAPRCEIEIPWGIGPFGEMTSAYPCGRRADYFNEYLECYVCERCMEGL